ncbi:MAG: ACT domain-containing protein [Lachnospiraceae bacterium]|nr:ACT domain-containing protein [Lachnospiraceae bacterium]
MRKAIITVVGKDSVGIIAKVCTYLAGKEINILDISQTITGGFFNMMMIIDLAKCEAPFQTIQTDLYEIGKTLGTVIHMQDEAIFDSMHRI